MRHWSCLFTSHSRVGWPHHWWQWKPGIKRIITRMLHDFLLPVMNRSKSPSNHPGIRAKPGHYSLLPCAHTGYTDVYWWFFPFTAPRPSNHYSLLPCALIYTPAVYADGSIFIGQPMLKKHAENWNCIKYPSPASNHTNLTRPTTIYIKSKLNTTFYSPLNKTP